MVSGVPSAGEAVQIPATIREITPKGFLTVAMHTVGFTFVAKLASC